MTFTRASLVLSSLLLVVSACAIESEEVEQDDDLDEIAAGSNLLQNPGFSNGTASWPFHNVHVLASAGYHGDGLRLEAPNQGLAWIRQRVTPIHPTAQFAARVMVRLRQGGIGQGYLLLGCIKNDSMTTKALVGFSASTSWHRVSTRVDCPLGTERLEVQALADDRQYDVDDFELFLL